MVSIRKVLLEILVGVLESEIECVSISIEDLQKFFPFYVHFWYRDPECICRVMVIEAKFLRGSRVRAREAMKGKLGV